MTELIFIMAALASSVYGLILSVVVAGPDVLTFFTLLSNVMVIVSMCSRLVQIHGGKKDDVLYGGEFLRAFRFITAVSILVTFLVFLLLLAPTSSLGFIGAFLDNHCASIAMHLIAPVCTVIDYIVYDPAIIGKGRVVPYSTMFPISYVIFAWILGRCGYKWPGCQLVMPYNFLNYEAPCGWFGFRPDTIDETTLGVGVAYMIVILAAVFALIGAGIYLVKKKIHGIR